MAKMVRSSVRDLERKMKTKLSEADVLNRLDSDSTSDALSAKAGRILKEEVDKKLPTDSVVDDLLTEDSASPLSAQQGVELKRLIENMTNELISKGSISIEVKKTFVLETENLSSDELNGRTIVINESSQIII